MIDARRTIRTITRARQAALAVGGAGSVLLVAGWALNPAQGARSYLFAYIFWLQIPLGCLAVSLLHVLVGGLWGRLLHPFVIPASATLPLFALFFVPICLSLDHLFVWHAASEVISDEKVTFSFGHC